jgi:hypothetical protein
MRSIILVSQNEPYAKDVLTRILAGQGGKIGGFYRYVLGAGESFEVKFDYGNANGAQGSNDGPAGSATMGYCKTGVAKGNGQTCDKDPMQMN